MKTEVTIVFFELQNKKRYVSELPFRPDNSIVPIYSEKEEDAHQYENETEAQRSIARFVNYNNRQFKTKRTVVKGQRRNPFGVKTEGALLD